MAWRAPCSTAIADLLPKLAVQCAARRSGRDAPIHLRRLHALPIKLCAFLDFATPRLRPV